MANMQYMQAQATSVNTRFVENLGNKAINRINKQYGTAVDEMFERLHKQVNEGNFSPEDADYTRVGFGTKADRDRFVTDMTNSGVEATFATEKVGGQWLVEIPDSVKVEDLKGELREKLEASGKSGRDFVASRAIIDEFSQRTYVHVKEPTPVEVREEADITTIQTGAHRAFTKHLDDLGRVIERTVNFSKELEMYSASDDSVIKNGRVRYDDSGNREGFEMGNVKSAHTKTAVVLNGDTVLIGGQVVTDKALKQKILKKHEERMRLAGKTKIGDLIVSKTDRLNQIRADKGKKPFKPLVTGAYAGKKAVMAAAYKQEYVVDVSSTTVAESFKDIQLSSDEADALDKLVRNDLLSNEKFSDTALGNIADLGATGTTHKLSFKDRRELENQLHKQAGNIRNAYYRQEHGKSMSEEQLDLVSKFSKEDAAALDEAANKVKLSEREKLQEKETDKKGGFIKGLITIDFGLKGLETVAEGLNLDWNVAHAAKEIEIRSPNITLGKENSVSLFDDMTKVGGLSDSELGVLNKVKGTAQGEKVKLTAEERVHLNEAISKYETVRKKDLTASDKSAINELRGKLALNDDEIGSVKRISSLKKDLGVPISAANFTPEKLLEMNKVLIGRAQETGLNIFTKNGKSVDVDKLKTIAANPEYLKKLGVSGSSMKVMIDVNKAQITNPHLLGGVAGVSGGIVRMAMKLDESGSITELYSAVNKLNKGVKYTKSGVVAVRNQAKALKLKRDTKKAKKSGYGKRKSDIQKRKPKTLRKKDKLHNVSPEKLAKMGKKAVKKQEKALKKATRREKSLIGRYNKMKTKVMTRLANTALGRLVVGAKKFVNKVLIKPAIIAGGFLVLLEGIIIVIMVVIMTISAFLENINPINLINNALAPETYADTVAYTIYEDYLSVKEEEWVEEELQGFDSFYANRVEMKYGSSYEDFQTYMANFDNIVLKDNDGNGYYSDIYINPFAASGVSHDGIIHAGYEVTDDGESKYNGSQTVSIGANNNEFGLIEEEDTSVSMVNYTTTESGHTCNIKDILCMIDVMYGMDLDEVGSLDDTTSQSVLGMSPEQVSFEDGVDNVVGWFKWLWNTIQTINPFSDSKYEPLKNFCNGKVGMKTIIKYAETLYESSHQQEISLSVEYCNYDDLILQTDNGEVDVSDSTSQTAASQIGYCVDTVQTKFYLKWNSTRVSPYFTQYENGTGEQYVVDLPTDESGYDVQVTMDDMVSSTLLGQASACLKYMMGSNSSTYNYIKELVNGTSCSCWEQTIDGEVLSSVSASANTLSYFQNAGGTDYYVADGDGGYTLREGASGWYDTEAAAKESVADYLLEVYNNTTIPDTTYYLSEDRNLFTRTYYEQPTFSVDYGETTTSERITGYHEEEEEAEVYRYWIDGTTTYDADDESTYATEETDFGCVWGVRKWNSDGTACLEDEDGQPVWYAEGFRSETAAQTWLDNHAAGIEIATGGTFYYSIEPVFTIETVTVLVPEYSTFYHSSGTCVTLEEKYDEFVRDCDGHWFEYCGGHISVHSHGVVYSFTNEQIAMLAVRDESNGNPLADGFDLAENGYDNIRGKIIKSEVDYGNVTSAASSGGCESPWVDPQGSLSGMYGLNLKTEGTEWASGYATRIANSAHLLRDIFDVDTNILKGDNIFPLYNDFTNYEGWTEDNMTLALLKWSADWYEEYGFDIPQEIWHGKLGSTNSDGTITPYDYGYSGVGQASLSTDDIEAIVDALKSAYGSQFDEEREDAVRLTLGFVGKGHYSESHSHNFLAEACQGLTVSVRDDDGNEGTVTYSGCCTAGDEDDFTNYIRLHFGKSAVSENGYTTSYWYNSSSGTSNALPADIIAHQATDDILSISVGSHAHNLTKNMVRDLIDESKFHTAVFIGIVDTDIQLSTGQVIEAGVPIVVDLTSLNDDGVIGIGNIYLHGRIGNGLFSGLSFDDYEWLYEDTSKTRLIRFN